MGFFNTIGDFFGSFFNIGTDFLIFIFVILYMVLFFAIQFYLIKGYIWLGKFVYDGYFKLQNLFLMRLGKEPVPTEDTREKNEN